MCRLPEGLPVNVIVLIAAGVAIWFLSMEQENEREKHSHDGSHSVDRNGGNQPGGIPQENRERITETKPDTISDSVPVPEPTNKKD
jgi:hypothetical protein